MTKIKNKIVLFENQNIKLEVNLKDDTVWLSLDQMSDLFGRDKSVISRHIKNVNEEELKGESTVAKFATVQKEGKRTVTREIEYYNLDMIISVGYRVKSKQGVTFRKWANSVLKDYMVKGYVINKQRLEYLEKTVKLIDIAGRVDEESKEIIKVINEYSKALNLLDDYDHENITKPRGSKSTNKITYEDSISIINKLKEGNNSDVFALERDKGLDSIINTIYQTYDGQDIYKTIEEKAANFYI